MALAEERACVSEHDRVSTRLVVTRPASHAAAAVAVALAAGALLAVRLDLPAFFDNEGRYAEVAREMVLTGDWVTPRMDFTVFLNKPPLLFWLTGLVFRVVGPTEWARLVSIAAAVVALYATARLAASLYGGRPGLLAAVVLATSLGFALEARTLRADMVLMASVVVGLLCWRRAMEHEARRGWWLAGLYAALGVGVLAKGMVAPVVAGVPIVLVTLRARGWRGLLELRPGLGVVVLAAIVLPWHVAVALKHPGFAWDYVVNQHLLFFLDKKLPRDSEGDPLPFFWAAFLGRALPWSILLPLTLGEARAGARRGATALEQASFFLWGWTGGVLLLFSLAPSRLEHYSLPALPAAAMLAARAVERAREGRVGAGAWMALAVSAAVGTVVGVVGVLAGPTLLGRVYWLAQQPTFLWLARPAGATVALVGATVLVAALRRQPDLVAGGLAVGTVPMVAIVLHALVAAEALFSWRPIAAVIAGAVPRDVEVVFEAPEEYQQVGGLAYYTGRRITLLEPPGFVPPTYLAGHMKEMFLPRVEFERRWRAGDRLALVSDPQQRREEAQGLVPDPFRVIGRFGDRWVLISASAAAR